MFTFNDGSSKEPQAPPKREAKTEIDLQNINNQ
jgi:hypothetical protein